jgi:hypothetical protein
MVANCSIATAQVRSILLSHGRNRTPEKVRAERRIRKVFRFCPATLKKQPGRTAAWLRLWRGTLVPTAISQFRVTLLFDGDIIYHVPRALDRLRDVPRAVFGIARICEAAQLHGSFEGCHLHIFELVLRIVVQRFLNPRCGGGIIDPFASAFVVTVARAKNG